MYLTPHFSLAELTVSEAGARAGLKNTPSEMQVEHLRALAKVLEKCRVILGGAILIKSGFRSPMINALVGGVGNSAHLAGWAADLICPRFGDAYSVCMKLAKELDDFDQIIYEYESWCHLSIDPQNRRQVLTKKEGQKYKPGLIG